MQSTSPMDVERLGESPKETHLSYPEPSTSKEATPPPAAQPRQLLKDRLYIGNLHPTVDEYVLLQVFSKLGKVSKLDFLFHKSGPLKGKPRGYAFLEYADPNDARKALASANDKLLRGRKLVVTYAQQAPIDPTGASAAKSRRAWDDTSKTTTLSLLKSTEGRRAAGTGDKIAKMEAKLRQLEDSPVSGSSMAKHSSLPAKPVAAALAVASMDSLRPKTKGKRTQTPLPSLPLPPQSSSTPSNTIMTGRKPSSAILPASNKSKALAGVIMKKRKDP